VRDSWWQHGGCSLVLDHEIRRSPIVASSVPDHYAAPSVGRVTGGVGAAGERYGVLGALGDTTHALGQRVFAN
jgi:hypothetical protein